MACPNFDLVHKNAKDRFFLDKISTKTEFQAIYGRGVGGRGGVVTAMEPKHIGRSPEVKCLPLLFLFKSIFYEINIVCSNFDLFQ